MEEFGDFFPENPRDARRVARADGAAHGGDAGDDELDDARAAGAVATAQRPAAGGHGSPLADEPTRPEPAVDVSADGLGSGLSVRGQRPDGHGPGDADHAGARRPRPVGEPAAQRDLTGRARRSRHGSGARPDGRRRRPFAAAAGRAHQDVAGSRPDRAEGRSARTDAEGLAQDRVERAARSVRQAGQGQGRPPPDGSSRPGARAHVRDQAVRVRRSVQPRSASHHPQRAAPQRPGHAGAAVARRLRDRDAPSTSPARRPC